MAKAGRARDAAAALLLGAAVSTLAPPSARAAAVLITNLKDATFSQVSPASTQSAVIHNCVNSSSGRYRVTATGTGGASTFQLNAGAGLNLPYSVEWSDSGSATTGDALTPGVALTGQTTPFITSCLLGSISATVIVRLAASDLQQAVAGVTYTGALTLLVAPE